MARRLKEGVENSVFWECPRQAYVFMVESHQEEVGCYAVSGSALLKVILELSC